MRITSVIQRGLIADDSYGSAMQIVKRNMPGDCEMTPATALRKIIDIAEENLRQANVFTATFPNGDCIDFVGRLPLYVSIEAAIAAIRALDKPEDQ